ncbi:hypothetical protein Ancab_002934 [Ancistrocladus abbreviatus]
MGESGRRRSSKWDSRRVDRSPGDILDSARPRKRESAFYDKEADTWHLPTEARNNAPNNLPKQDIDMQPREPLSGRRDFQKHENMTEKSLLAWDREGKYTTRMSPGLEEWRQQIRSRSPKRSWARSHRARSSSRSHSRSQSRSRSPARRVRRESGFDDRSRNRSGVSSQSCRDFAAGRCRRADRCPFLHHDGQNYDRRHSESGVMDVLESRHQKSGASRYLSDDSRDYSLNGRSVAHHAAASNGFRKGVADDVYRDGDNDKRSRTMYPGRSYDHEPSKTTGAPCKFFAQGNCRNGKNCRYSHHLQEVASPQKRSVDKMQVLDHNVNGVDRVWNGPKWGDVTTATDDLQVQGCPEDEKSEVKGAVPRDTAWSGDGSWNHNFGLKTHTPDAPTADESVVSNDQQPLQWRKDDAIADMDVSESKRTEECPGISEIQSTKFIVQKQMGQLTHNSEVLSLSQTALPPGEPGIAQEVVFEKQYSGGILQPKIFDDSYSQQKFGEGVTAAYPGEEKSASLHPNLKISMNILPGQGSGHVFSCDPISGSSAIGQGQPTMPLLPSGVEGMQMSHNQSFLNNRITNGPDTGDVNVSQSAAVPAPSLSTVPNEGLVEASHLSTTLAQLLENKQQLSELYAALAPHGAIKGVSSRPDLMPSIPPASKASFQPNEVDGYKTQYDPICDSIEPKMPTASTPDLINPKHSVHGTSNIPISAGGATSTVNAASTGNDSLKAGTLANEVVNHQINDLNQQRPVAVNNIEENGGKLGEGINRPLEKQPLEEAAVDGGPEDRKKAKELKGIRSFKFALAEFVKELLKPTWKEGQVSKEVYKTIVKKVVDKVMDTVQGAHIPQTKEKVDQYLSFSKPKLSKLVQAYVEKYQKS